MRNVYRYLDLRLSRLVPLYLVVYVFYLYLPIEFEYLRPAISHGLLGLLIITTLAAITKIMPVDRTKS
jgi:hypothetical protein